jgi:hypothetical protein
MNSPLFTPERAPYPDEDLAVCVQTLRAFSAEDEARAPSSAEGLEGALSASAEQSEPRTPFDWSDKARTMLMQEEPARWWWAEDADSEQEATVPVGEREKKRALSPPPEAAEEDYYCRREATPRPPPSPIGDYAVDPAPAPEEEAAPAPVKKVRVCFSGQRMWGGAAAPKRARRAAKKAPKPLRVALPMGEDAMLARGALVYGMAGGKAEERRRLIEVARELRGGAADALEETINQELIPADAPLLSFGSGADDDLDLQRTGKSVARHAALVMDALDRLRAPENAAAAAERGLLVRWPECLLRCVLRCAKLHAYLDAWTAGVEYAR